MKRIKFLLPLLALLCLISVDANAISGEKKTLLLDTTLDATVTGSSVCLPRQSDDFSTYVKAVNGAGSSPTLDVVIEHSDDESNWIVLDTFTQITTGTNTVLRHINGTTTHVLRCVRAKATIGGTASPTYNANILMFYRIRN